MCTYHIAFLILQCTDNNKVKMCDLFISDTVIMVSIT